MHAESFFELLFFPPPPREVMTETEMGMPVPELAMVSATDISVVREGFGLLSKFARE